MKHFSDDFVVLEINIPGDFATVELDRETGAETVFHQPSEEAGAKFSGLDMHKGPFHASFLSEDSWSKGLRPYLEYRDLGMVEATGGGLQAYVVRFTEPSAGPITHYHDLEFPINYVLKGSAKVEFEGVDERTFGPHDSWYQKPRIKHEGKQYSEDFTVLGINIPAKFPTIEGDGETGEGGAFP